MDAARFAFSHGEVWKVGVLGGLIYGEKDVDARVARKGIVVLGEASEATVHGGTVRWRRRQRQRRRWTWSGVMGAEREMR